MLCVKLSTYVIFTFQGRLQKATRQLQSLALYGKRNRDKLLPQEGPKLKRVLEQLIYRMKDMAEDCAGSGTVYVGNLKSRDITGKEIIEEESASESESSSESESGGDESVHEGDDDDVEDHDTETRGASIHIHCS